MKDFAREYFKEIQSASEAAYYVEAIIDEHLDNLFRQKRDVMLEQLQDGVIQNYSAKFEEGYAEGLSDVKPFLDTFVKIVLDLEP